MTVTEESGGRLNVFAKEPEIQIIKEKSNAEKRSQLFIVGGSIILIIVFGWYFVH